MTCGQVACVERAAGTGGSGRRTRERRARDVVYSALIVPLGRSCAMAPRCTLISTFGRDLERRVLVVELGDASRRGRRR